MIKSSMAAFATMVVCFLLLQIPGRPETAPVPLSIAAPPSYETLPCPTGQCPLVPRVIPQPVRQIAPASYAPAAAAMPVVRNSNAHWTYPGDIDSHMAASHGVSTAGMSHEQALSMHDALHEGRTYASSTVTYSSVSAPVVRYVARRPVLAVATAPVRYVVNRQPIRSIARLPVRILQRQPVRSFVRRVFCR